MKAPQALCPQCKKPMLFSESTREHHCESCNLDFKSRPAASKPVGGGARLLATVIMAVLGLAALGSAAMGGKLLAGGDPALDRHGNTMHSGGAGPLQEIEGLMLLLICAVSLTGVGVIAAITSGPRTE